MNVGNNKVILIWNSLVENERMDLLQVHLKLSTNYNSYHSYSIHNSELKNYFVFKLVAGGFSVVYHV